MTGGFHRITPVNGFDATDPNNARQNNYAWSMAELGDYIYVGTGRNIVYGALASGQFGPVTIPPVFVPDPVDMNGEIWRYKKDGSEDWQQVYKAPAQLTIIGFRFMLTFTTPGGETALYAGCMTINPGVIILKSVNGVDWNTIPGQIPGNSTRAMTIHGNKLYMGVLDIQLSQTLTRLYASQDPENDGWQEVDLQGDVDKNPRGNIDALLSFNGHLFVAADIPGGSGFELWRSQTFDPAKDDWKLVVDKGAGDALNQIPISLAAFKDHLFLGTAIWLGIASNDPNDPYVPPKGFDLIRINKSDRWELIAGGLPISPTQPETGQRGLPLSGFPSGFGNLANAYCWQLLEYNGELYLGSWDWSVLIPDLAPAFEPILPINIRNYLVSIINFISYIALRWRRWGIWSMFRNLLPDPGCFLRIGFGFDMWKSRDGIHWIPVTFNGLNNPHNYGLRTLLASSNRKLYLGTANPYDGCEVWVKGGRHC